MSKTIKMQMEGYEVVEKKADKGGNSGRVYVPKHWIGKKVRVVLIEQ
jgi:putative transposon-encoded protein